MTTKALEIRDEATFIAALAVDMNPSNDQERWLLRRCGYPCDGRPNIILTRLDGNETHHGDQATNDPYARIWSHMASGASLDYRPLGRTDRWQRGGCAIYTRRNADSEGQRKERAMIFHAISYIYGELYLWWILHLRKRYRMRVMQQAVCRGKGWYPVN